MWELAPGLSLKCLPSTLPSLWGMRDTPNGLGGGDGWHSRLPMALLALFQINFEEFL